MVPASFRKRFGLREGARFRCTVNKGSLVFTPETAPHPKTRTVLDKKTGLWITQATPDAPVVMSEQVRAAMEDFP